MLVVPDNKITLKEQNVGFEEFFGEELEKHQVHMICAGFMSVVVDNKNKKNKKIFLDHVLKESKKKQEYKRLLKSYFDGKKTALLLKQYDDSKSINAINSRCQKIIDDLAKNTESSNI